MSITNLSKPSSSIANSSKPQIGYTWDTILTTWAAELMTWDAVGTFISNQSKVSSSISNVAKP